MAVMRSREIPKDAIEMDERDAVMYAWDVVSNWESLSDVWALRYSPTILGGISAASGILVNHHFRHKLKLATYGYYSSVLPISLLPGILTALFHKHFISTDLLLMKNHGCPICYEVKSGLIQVTFGTAYPMILGPLSGAMLASRYNTYRVPSLTETPKEVFKLMAKITRPLYSTLIFVSAFQFVASSIITYFEMRNTFKIRRTMLEIEDQISREEGEKL